MIYYFTDSSVGVAPASQLVFGLAGSLYGTTLKDGAVFELVPSSEQTAAAYALHIFGAHPGDGMIPGEGLPVGKDGTLYGTTTFGGTRPVRDGRQGGTVYAVIPPSQTGGQWTGQVLHDFGGSGDGFYPTSKLAVGADGVLYGTAIYGPADGSGCGNVFALAPLSSPGASWTESLIHQFSNGNGGCGPVGGVLLDSTGVIYGTTVAGGASNYGTIFSLRPPSVAGGSWAYSVLHEFIFDDGIYPETSLVEGSDGVLYGTTHQGGTADPINCEVYGCGTVYALKP